MCALLVCVPLRKVHLNPEALSEVIQYLAAGGTALLHDNAQHLWRTALVEGIVLTAFDQLLVDLEVCEVHQGLEDSSTETMSYINHIIRFYNLEFVLFLFWSI